MATSVDFFENSFSNHLLGLTAMNQLAMNETHQRMVYIRTSQSVNFLILWWLSTQTSISPLGNIWYVPKKNGKEHMYPNSIV
jgi:hypothetical protein